MTNKYLLNEQIILYIFYFHVDLIFLHDFVFLF